MVLTADTRGFGKKLSDIQLVYCRTNCIDMMVFEQKMSNAVNIFK